MLFSVGTKDVFSNHEHGRGLVDRCSLKIIHVKLCVETDL